MLYVIRRNQTEWIDAFLTLAEAKNRHDALMVKNPDWRLYIFGENQKESLKEARKLLREERKKHIEAKQKVVDITASIKRLNDRVGSCKK